MNRESLHTFVCIVQQLIRELRCGLGLAFRILRLSFSRAQRKALSPTPDETEHLDLSNASENRRGLLEVLRKLAKFAFRAANLFSQFVAIIRSGLFDASFYLETNQDLAQAGIPPLVHFVLFGGAEGRDPSPLFDTDWYVAKYPDVAAAGINPLMHYLLHGASEGRDPNPFFDTRWYISRYPEAASKRINPLAHFVRHGLSKQLDPNPTFNTALYLREHPHLVASGTNPLKHYLTIDLARKKEIVVTAYDQLKDIEPALQSISHARFKDMAVRSANRENPPHYPALKAFFYSLDRSYDRIVFMPWIVYGGADLVTIHALRAVQERHGVDSVLVVVSDYGKLPARHWLPRGTHLRVLSDYDPTLSFEARVHIVSTIIHSLQPKAVLNVNSHACWEAYARYGRPLAHSTALYAMLFCYDYSHDGRIAGYAVEYFRECLSFLTRIYSDNASWWNELSSRYGMPSHYCAKFVTLYQPWEMPSTTSGLQPFPAPPPNDGFPVFWAGRICSQKNPSLLVQVARKCPECRFDVYGICDPQYEALMTREAPPNLHWKGPYKDFEQIPVGSYGAYLYTSLWDGLPNVLIKAAVLGVPVVASGLDGILELIDEGTGWPVRDYKSVDGYVKAIEELRTEPDASLRKVEKLYERVMTRHAWDQYLESFSQSPSFLE